jgi:hypothetical protein
MTKQFTSPIKKAYLEQFYQSGLTQTAFCRQQGLVFKTFNKWLKDSKATPAKLHQFKSPAVNSEEATHHFPNEIAPNISQAAFIPIHLKDTDVCAPSKRQPPQLDCPKKPYESVLCFKTKGFCVTLSLDLSSEYGQVAMGSLTQALHQLPGGQDSYD